MAVVDCSMGQAARDSPGARNRILPGLTLLGFAALALALMPGAEAQSTGGPDLGGYTWIDSTAAGGPAYAHVNIALNGTTVAPVLGDDSDALLTLPFSFTWYGFTTTQARISSNGYLCFDASNSCSAITGGLQPPPSVSTPGRLVSAFNKDLHCGSQPTCAYTHSWGPVGSRVFVVMMNAQDCYPLGTGCNLNYEFKVFEGANCVEVHYAGMLDVESDTVFAGTEGTSPGGTVTGLSYHYASPSSTAGTTLQNKAVRYCQTQAPPPACTPGTQNVSTGVAVLFNVAGGTPGYTWTAVGGSPNSGPGASFSTTFAAPGAYTVFATDSTGLNSTNCQVNVTAPGCGYTVNAAAPFFWQDIMGTGIAVSGGGAGSDDNFEIQPLNAGSGAPFTFSFCGNNYTQVYLGSNGLICFAPGTSCSSNSVSTLPSTFRPRPAVMGYYEDLFPPGCGSGACVKYQVLPNGPSRVFIYQFEDVPFWDGSGIAGSFQFKLFEDTDCIEVHYDQVQPGANSMSAGFNNAAGTAGYNYAFGPWSRTQQAWSACPFSPATADTATVLEDSGTTNLNVLSNDNAGATVTSVSSGTCLLQASCATPKGTATVAPGGAGILYQPGLDESGADSFTYRNSAGGTATVTVTVTPVNDAPTFTAGPTVFAAQGGLPQQFAGWATLVAPATGNIAAPARALDELPQSMSFAMTTPPSPIFAVQPTIARSSTAASLVPSPTAGDFGILEFTPATNAYGTANVCFEPQDDGGNVPPHIGVGAERCFNITVHQCEPAADEFIAYRWWTLSAPSPTANLMGILDNDAAAPQMPVELYAGTSHGTLALEPTGSFTYTPDIDYLGLDQFQYTVNCNGTRSGPVTVEIDVRINQEPVAYFEPASPMAAPGEDLTFNPCPGTGNQCSHDPDGSIASYLWEFGDGQTSRATWPVHAYTMPGTYVARLTVRDLVGNASTYARSIDVGWPDSAPFAKESSVEPGSLVADAGRNRTVFELDRVTLTGAQQGGAESTRYLWSKVSGPAVTLVNASSPAAWFEAPALPDGKPVDIVLGLRVYDGDRASPLSYIVIHVLPRNHPPVADAGGMQTVMAGSTVTLDASGSTDPDGATGLTFLWQQVGGDAPVRLSDAAAKMPTFQAPADAVTLRFRLQVSDGSLLGQDEAMVTVLPVGSTPPDVTFTYTVEGDEVRFVAASGLLDPTWDFGDGSPQATGSPVLHRFEPGLYTVRMMVGEGAASSTQQVDVPASPESPTAGSAAVSPSWLPILGGVALLLAVSACVVLWLRRR